MKTETTTNTMANEYLADPQFMKVIRELITDIDVDDYKKVSFDCVIEEQTWGSWDQIVGTTYQIMLVYDGKVCKKSPYYCEETLEEFLNRENEV